MFQDDLLLLLSYFSSGLSVYELKHYLQIAKSDKFQKYNFGILNIINYVRFRPPTYNLKKIRVSVCLFYGENDALATQNVCLRLTNSNKTKQFF